MGQDEQNQDQTEKKGDQPEEKVEEPKEQVNQPKEKADKPEKRVSLPDENVEKPENQSEKQKEQPEKMKEEHEKKVDQHAKKGGEHEKKGGEHEKKGGEHEKKGGEHEKKGGEHEKKGGEHEKKSGEHEKKENEHKKKGDEPEKKVDKKGRKSDQQEKTEDQKVDQTEKQEKQEDEKEKTADQPTTEHHEETAIERKTSLEEEEDSVCDWHPPPEVPIQESESLIIPSHIPSLESFMARIYEIEENEQAAAKAEAEAEAEEEGEEEEEAQVDDRLSIEKEEDEDSLFEYEKDIAGDDLFETKFVEVKKPKEKPKVPQLGRFSFVNVQDEIEKSKHRERIEAAERLQLYLEESTDNFINGLIGDVVETCEYEDPDEVLRARLDKPEILRELDDKLNELDVEQKTQFMLNRKVVDFFLRKKNRHPMINDPPEDVLHIIRKYRDVLGVVNYYKGLEQEIKDTIQDNVIELRQKKRELEEIAEEKTNEFCKSVYDALLGTEASERMEQLAEISTRRVRNMLKEISNVRFVLIQRLHTLAVLQEDLRNFEDLGNGLRMSDYENLQTETQALGKKVEEKTNEIIRLHQRHTTDLHNIAHCREKQSMMRSKIVAQQEFIADLIEEKKSCREYLNDLKLHRIAIRREYKRTSISSGLLDKPELLLDYDATQESLTVLRAKVASVKAEQLALDLRMKEMKRNMS